jgi:hypothetical protein
MCSLSQFVGKDINVVLKPRYPITGKIIMNVSLKFATGLVLAAGLVVASGNVARAGEGGAAGSVSIKFDSNPANDTTITSGPITITAPSVDRLSSSVSVGKNFAAATGFTVTGSGGETRTAAIGGGGTATLANANAAAATYTGIAEDVLTLPTNQSNAFGAGGDATLAPVTGVTLP